MAAVVHVTPEQLTAAGRPDAAGFLEDMLENPPPPVAPPSFADLTDPAEAWLVRTPEVTADTVEALIVTLHVMRQRENANAYRENVERELRELRRRA